MTKPFQPIRYKTSLAGVDWEALKASLQADQFDNGRTPAQLQRSFRNSFAYVIAYEDNRIIGTARALSDGVCNAYIVDVWTHTPYRRRGVARAMVATMEAKLRGQHVALFTQEALGFYKTLGYREEAGGLSKVIGSWLSGAAG